MTVDPVLSVRDLTVSFPHASGRRVTVVDKVGFDVMAGEIVGLVGESGSGKSITARAVMRLLPGSAAISGQIRLANEDVLAMTEKRLRALRGSVVSMIFQDPMTSFDPVHRIGAQIKEAIAVHRPRHRLAAQVGSLLARVGIAPARGRAFPHELSGGMRQRAMTAMAIANGPALMIADEPTTALDVTVQDQILQLMRDLNAGSGTAILLIAHNIAVVASLCSRLIVLYAGRVVEDGPADALLTEPRHPYTWSLLRSVPRLDKPTDRLVAIAGQPPDPAERPAGCQFQPRCPRAVSRCAEMEPPLAAIATGHHVRCWRPMEAAA
jgi:oligopeptide/dipeptide ABC transporter ATP-binding protein